MLASGLLLNDVLNMAKEKLGFLPFRSGCRKKCEGFEREIATSTMMYFVKVNSAFGMVAMYCIVLITTSNSQRSCCLF